MDEEDLQNPSRTRVSIDVELPDGYWVLFSWAGHEEVSKKPLVYRFTDPLWALHAITSCNVDITFRSGVKVSGRVWRHTFSDETNWHEFTLGNPREPPWFSIYHVAHVVAKRGERRR